MDESRKKDRFSMFQIGTTKDGETIYYDYEEKKFYGTYSKGEEEKLADTSWYYLAIPIALGICYGINVLFKCCNTGLGLILLAGYLVANYYLCRWMFRKIDQKGKRQREHNLTLLANVSREDEADYVLLAKESWKQQIKLCVCSLIVLVVCLILFWIFKNSIFLMIHTAVFFIVYVLYQVFEPYQKRKFIKQQ